MSAGASPQRVPLEVLSSEATTSGESEESRWRPALHLPVLLTVELPLPHFKVSDLLQLKVGSVVRAHWRLSRDVPLRANGTLIGWSELEVMGKRLAIRLTELV